MLGAADSELSLVTVAVRLLVAILAGGAIGFDREKRGKQAGLRTCMLVALAAALFTIMMSELASAWTVDDMVVLDPGRIVEAVTSGVAFIAAGTIISHRGEVSGLTTGAAIWVAGALGATAGAGFYGIALVAAAIGFLVLAMAKLVERFFSS
jgi:putative Mg2+ transporter-C (MgtC) family protein